MKRKLIVIDPMNIIIILAIIVFGWFLRYPYAYDYIEMDMLGGADETYSVAKYVCYGSVHSFGFKWPFFEIMYLISMMIIIHLHLRERYVIAMFWHFIFIPFSKFTSGGGLRRLFASSLRGTSEGLLSGGFYEYKNIVIDTVLFLVIAILIGIKIYQTRDEIAEAISEKEE